MIVGACDTRSVPWSNHATTPWHGPVTPVVSGRHLLDVGPPAPNETLRGSDSRALDGLGQEGGASRLRFFTDDQPLRARTAGSLTGDPRAAQWALAGQAAVKIGVRRTGWFRVTQAALVTAGLDPHVDPRTLRMFVGGVEQAITVTGEADGRLDAGDAIGFYGEGVDTAYTETRVYWVVAGAERGKRVGVVAARAPPQPPPTPDPPPTPAAAPTTRPAPPADATDRGTPAVDSRAALDAPAEEPAPALIAPVTIPPAPAVVAPPVTVPVATAPAPVSPLFVPVFPSAAVVARVSAPARAGDPPSEATEPPSPESRRARHRRALAARAVETEIELAREAGVPEALIEEILAAFDPEGSAEKNRQIADDLRRARLTARGYDVSMSRGEYNRLQGLAARAADGSLTDADVRWLRGKVAAEPSYFDELPRRGRMTPEASGNGAPADDFQPGLDAASAETVKSVFEAATASAPPRDAGGEGRRR